MAPQAWVFKYGAGGTVFTSSVLSFSGQCGRQNPMSNYAGGSFQITIKNDANQIANFPRGTKVVIYLYSSIWAFSGKVTGIQYNDYPGNTGLSTATITCLDIIGQAGKYILKQFAYIPDYSAVQAAQTNTIAYPNGPQVTYVAQVPNSGDSYCSGTSAVYNSTILGRINTLVNTERGMIFATDTSLLYKTRSQLTGTNTVAFVRDGGNSARLAYTSFRRIAAGDNFMNQVNVQPEDATIQQGNNAASQSAYGIAGYTVNSVDYFASDALSLAQWLANSQGDPTTLRYEVDFSDIASDGASFSNFLYSYLYEQRPLTQLEWRAQGGSLNTEYVAVEGLSFSGTPERTNMTAFLSPFTYYNMFILNSSTNGVLDSSRLGWKSA